jgi:intein/homing endonuclease
MQTSKAQLKRMGVSYIELGNKLYVIGTQANELATIFNNSELKRPMRDGMLNSKEQDALPILAAIIKALVGTPEKTKETCVYSVPAQPIDVEREIEYHDTVLKTILNNLGFYPKALNEAVAVANVGLIDNLLTGISVSCLTPEQPIITDMGLKQIKDIKPGDRVLNLSNKFEPVENVIIKKHTGNLVNIKVRNSYNTLKVTPEHEIYVKHNNNWQWLRADELSVDDILQEPILQTNLKENRLYISIKEKKTNSKTLTSRVIQVSRKVAKFLGYFLGDGHATQVVTDGRERYTIQFDFSKDELEYAEDVKDVIINIFKRTPQIIEEPNKIRIIFSDKYLHSWLRTHCYDAQGCKVFPWKADEIPFNSKIGFIEGLLGSDGSINKKLKHVTFTNTSNNLATNLYLLIQSMGVSCFINKRSPRAGGFINNRQIIGKNDIYELQVNGFDAVTLIAILESEDIKRRAPIQPSHKETRITELTTSSYDGDVYDLTVDGNHSYCVPGIAVHNCGAGMTNIAIMYKGIAVATFSIARGGDWIDQMVAKEMNITTAKARLIKEKSNYSIASNAIELKTREQSAIKTYYEAYIRYILKYIEHQFTNNTSMPTFPDAIPIVVAGGGCMVNGFIEIFKEQFIGKDFPIDISEIKLAEEPLTAIARGCLIEAELGE